MVLDVSEVKEVLFIPSRSEAAKFLQTFGGFPLMLVGDWKAILNARLDREELTYRRSRSKSLKKLLSRFQLADRISRMRLCQQGRTTSGLPDRI